MAAILFFVGVGGTLTGRGGDINILDDPVKNRKEADSPIVREALWNWYNNVLRYRMMTQDAALVIIATRWNEDDIIGRHTDPTNPYYNEEEAATWSIINLPALAEEDDPLGRPIDQPLWPSRFGTQFLLDQRRADARGFSALYQGRPTPAEGSFFKNDHIRTYNKMSDLPHPDSLRYYGASVTWRCRPARRTTRAATWWSGSTRTTTFGSCRISSGRACRATPASRR